MATKPTLSAADFFVLLEKAFRRRSKLCRRCAFTLPFRVWSPDGQANWAVLTDSACSEKCRLVLEDLLDEYRHAYRMSDSGRFRVRPAASLRR